MEKEGQQKRKMVEFNFVMHKKSYWCKCFRSNGVMCIQGITDPEGKEYVPSAAEANQIKGIAEKNR